jgi:hypothetical protein
MWKRVVTVFMLAVFMSGCTVTDVVRLEPACKVQIPGQPYERLGKVHAESWGVCLAYVAPLAGSMERARGAAERMAARRGADAVINAECYSETHMPVLMLLGWKENHFSGDAVKYVK